MNFMERSRAGIPTSDDDEDIGEFLQAIARASALCERFNFPGTPWSVRKGVLEELFGQALDDDTVINPSFRCDIGVNIHLGKHVRMNYDCVILDSADVTIGDYVMIGPKVSIVTPNHTFPPERRRSVATVARPVTICDDVWIGAGATILPGVTVGEGAIIGAGAVVTKDVPPGETWVGVPARPIGDGDA